MEEHRCKNLLASLSDYVDGSLSENLCTEIERHMAGCENCRLVVDSLRTTIIVPGPQSQWACQTMCAGVCSAAWIWMV
jgi:hypothetical protein